MKVSLVRRWWGVRVREGCRFPRGYGMGWFDAACLEAVCYPMPLNWVVWVWDRVVRAVRVTPLDRRVVDGLTSMRRLKGYELDIRRLEAELYALRENMAKVHAVATGDIRVDGYENHPAVDEVQALVHRYRAALDLIDRLQKMAGEPAKG